MCPMTRREFVTGLPGKVEFTSNVELMAAVSINCFFSGSSSLLLVWHCLPSLLASAQASDTARFSSYLWAACFVKEMAHFCEFVAVIFASGMWADSA
jgi:hypothetical protein